MKIDVAAYEAYRKAMLPRDTVYGRLSFVLAHEGVGDFPADTTDPFERAAHALLIFGPYPEIVWC